MSITTSVKNRVVDALNMAFGAIGVSAETKMPRGKKGDNLAPIAWEYYVSDHVLALARARNSAAKKAAVAAGVLFDHEKNPREPGNGGVVYLGEHVVVTLDVRAGSDRVDANRMADYLIAHKVNPDMVANAVEYATSKTRPAHMFKVNLATSDPAK